MDRGKIIADGLFANYRENFYFRDVTKKICGDQRPQQKRGVTEKPDE
jgi:hypothetical protein